MTSSQKEVRRRLNDKIQELSKKLKDANKRADEAFLRLKLVKSELNSESEAEFNINDLEYLEKKAKRIRKRLSKQKEVPEMSLSQAIAIGGNDDIIIKSSWRRPEEIKFITISPEVKIVTFSKKGDRWMKSQSWVDDAELFLTNDFILTTKKEEGIIDRLKNSNQT